MDLSASISTILGGIGLFLLGMALMTDGLKALAGGRLRSLLARLTRRPGDAVLAGAGMTALVQSSSATTLATIGFVSAGLLPFHTAIGVIVGANIGTTSTGWLVALLGLKFSISNLAMPVVGVGALMRIMGRDRIAHAGAIAAGFGMIFVGIGFLQQGMDTLADLIDPSRYGSDDLGGRLGLVGIGLLMTVVMQSSSAAVATTLTALASGALNLDQAAALVIGQNVGTTITAVIGALGAGIQARRTAAIHVLFNLMTGVVAIALLPLFTGVVATSMAHLAPDDPALTIAAFHTAFNVLGAILFLPLARPAARLVQRLLREHRSSLTSHLHRNVAAMPDLAIQAARESLLSCMTRLMWQMSGRLGGIPRPPAGKLDELRIALPRIYTFLARIPPHSSSLNARQRQIDLMHCIDHLQEALELLAQDVDLQRIPHAGLAQIREHTLKVLDALRRDLHEQGHARPSRLKHLKEAIAKSRYRNHGGSQDGTPDVDALTQLMQMQHWIEQCIYHFWRALRHLEAGEASAADAVPAPGTEAETTAKAA